MVPGLSLRRGRVDRWCYRSGNHRVTLGDALTMTVDEAREQAIRLRSQWKQGIPPEPKLKRPTLSALIERYLAEGLERLAPKTASEYQTYLRQWRGVGHLHADCITPEALEDIIKPIGKRYPYKANRMLATFSALWSWSERNRLIPQLPNPARVIPRWDEHAREYHLRPAELERLGVAFASCGEAPTMLRFFLFLAVTGMRPGEATHLLKSQVQEGIVNLPRHKTSRKVGPRLVGLSDEALALLRDDSDSPYCFPGWRKGQPLIGYRKVWERIREIAALPNVRVYDLRHSWVALAVRSGFTLEQAGSTVGHADTRTSARYAHLNVAPQLEVARTVAPRVFALLGLSLNRPVDQAGGVDADPNGLAWP